MTDTNGSFSNPEETSLAAMFKKKREKIVDGLRLKLQIPHWEDPSVFAVFRPIQSDESGKLLRKVEKEKLPDDVKTMHLACDSLIAACIEVFYEDEDGKACSFGEDKNGPRTQFDQDTAKSIGCEDDRARAVLRYLYLNDGDLLTAYTQLMDWSGYGAEKTHEDYLGE